MVHEKTYHLSSVLDMKIALLSDIHYNISYDILILNNILNTLKDKEVDLICIAGDLLDQADALRNLKAKSTLMKFVRELAINAPVVIVPGNHDIAIESKKKTEPFYDQFSYHQIDRIPNVHVLLNRSFVFQDLCILGFVLPYEYYYGKVNEDVSSYRQELDNQLLSQIVPNKTNLLICHTPKYVTSPFLKESKVLSKVSYLFSGHMHGGMIPKPFHLIPGNRGLVSPFLEPFPTYARGIYTKEGRNHIISGGVVKFSGTSPKLLQQLVTKYPINMMYPTELEYLILENKNHAEQAALKIKRIEYSSSKK